MFPIPQEKYYQLKQLNIFTDTFKNPLLYHHLMYSERPSHPHIQTRTELKTSVYQLQNVEPL